MAAISQAEAAIELQARFAESSFFEMALDWGELQRVPLMSDSEFVFVIGGNSSGKTEIGSWSVADRILGFNPLTGEFRREERGRSYQDKPYEMYVVGTSESDVDQRMKPRILKWLPRDAEGSLFRVDRKNNTWIALDGTWKIYFKSVNQGARAFQGDEIDFVWIDEDPEDREVWNEMLARTGRRLGQVMVTMTAWQGTVWFYNFIRHPDEYPQEAKNINRIPLDANPYFYLCDCGHSERCHQSEHVACFKDGCDCTGYDPSRSNMKLQRYRQRWKGLDYKIRFEGHYLLMAGRQVFDADELDRKYESLRKAPGHIFNPPLTGYFNEKTQFVRTGMSEWEDPRSIVKIMKLPDPGGHYTMGVDVGGGNPTGDYHAAVVYDDETGDQCAVIHTRSLEPRDLAWPCVQLARFYEDAFMVPEANNVGQAFIDKVLEWGYGNIYRRKMIENIGGAPQNKTGFWTDKKSKRFAVQLAVDLFHNTWKIWDRTTLDEMYGYLYLKENREGQNGIGAATSDGHDDICSAHFLVAVGFWTKGLFHRAHSEDPLPPPPPKKEGLIEAIERDLNTKAVEEEDLLAIAEDMHDLGSSFQDELFGEMGGYEPYWNPDDL